MRHVFRMFLLMFIFAGLNAINAMPVYDDTGNQTTLIAPAQNDYDGIATSVSSSNTPTADFLPGIVCNFSNTTFSSERTKNDGTAGYLQKQVHPLRIKPNAAFYSKIEAKGDLNLGAHYFMWNSDKNYEGTTVEGVKANGDESGDASQYYLAQNLISANWTMSDATDYDDSGISQHYFSLNTGAQTLASAPNYNLRC